MLIDDRRMNHHTKEYCHHTFIYKIRILKDQTWAPRTRLLPCRCRLIERQFDDDILRRHQFRLRGTGMG